MVDKFTIKELMMLISLIFICFQGVITYVNKKWAKEIIDKFSENREQLQECVLGVEETVKENDLGFKDKIDDIHNIISAKDADQYPMVYVPRSWLKIQEEIIRACNDITSACSQISNTQRQSLEIIKAIQKKQIREME